MKPYLKLKRQWEKGKESKPLTRQKQLMDEARKRARKKLGELLHGLEEEEQPSDRSDYSI